MSEASEPVRQPVAWQPFTFGGVASYGHASFGRLFLMLVAMAAFCTGSFAWLLGSSIFPSIDEAISKLPTGSVIERGEFRWPTPGTQRLVENRFLAITVNSEDAPMLRAASDFQVELQRRQFKCSSLFGYLGFSYPTDWVIGLNRNEASPLWGAWKPALLSGLSLGFALFLFASWFFLATVYFVIPSTIAFYLDRPLGSGGAWKLSAAALMPGSLLMGISILLYQSGQLSLTTFLIVAGVHVILGWPYLLIAPCFIRRRKSGANPFAAEDGAEEPKRGSNPFRG